MKVGIAYSTKDRIEFTRQTLPRILDEAEGNFDLFWLDGSVTQAGIQFPDNFAYCWRKDHDGKYPVTEMHKGVGGGAACVIQTALNYIYSKGCYDYVGLIENDVLLEPGWFAKTMALFDKDPGYGIKTGIVSARCFTDRILERHGEFAEMADVGAGMCIMRKELVMPQLENWSQPLLWILQILCMHFQGKKYPVPPKVLEEDPKLERTWLMSHDWMWTPLGWHKGYTTLALTPSMAINLDDPEGKRDRVEA